MTNTSNTTAPVPTITVAVNPHGGALATRKGNVGNGNGYAVAYAVTADTARSTAQANGGVCAMYATRKAAQAVADGIARAGVNGAHKVVAGSVVVLPTVVVPADTATGAGSDLHAVGAWLYAAWLYAADAHAVAQAKRAAAAAKRAAAAKAKAAK